MTTQPDWSEYLTQMTHLLDMELDAPRREELERQFARIAAMAQPLMRRVEQAVKQRLARADGRIGHDVIERPLERRKAVAGDHLSPRAVVLQVATRQIERALVHVRHDQLRLRIGQR